MKKGKRNIRNILILVCVCAVMAAAYFLISANENPAESGVLFKLGNDKITQVKIDNQYGSFLFEQQDGAWIVESGGVYRTNPEKIMLLQACLEEFKIDRMLPEEKSEYGFENPQARVSVKTSGAREFSFVVGADAVNGSSVYIKSDGSVMLTSTGMTSQLIGSLTAYRAKDVLVVDPDKISSIDFYVKGAQTLSLTNTDYQSWKLQYPFDAPARNVIMNEVIGKLKELVIAGYVDSENNDEDTGLAEPDSKMVLTDQAGVQQTLEFGSINGNLKYVRIGAESDIVQLYAADIDFSELTPEEVMYIAPLNIDISEVQSISIQAGGSTDTFTLEHDNDGNISVNLNGAEIPFSTFVSVYYKYLALNADGYDTEQTAPGECEAICTTTLLNGDKVELSLFARDTDTLYMLINGRTEFYTQASSLSELIYRVKSAKADLKEFDLPQ